MRKVLYFLAGLLVVLIAIEVGIYQYLSKNRNPRHKKINVDPKSLLLSANEIPFRSEDNVDLVGWLIHGRSGYPALIVAHNYGSNRSETLARLER